MFVKASERKMKFRVVLTKSDDDACCPICHDDIKKGVWRKVFYACKHAYHIRCINEWLVRRLNCPMCRAPVIFNSTIYQSA